MKHFLTFLKHLSNIVWSSNLVVLQPVDIEPSLQWNGNSSKVLGWENSFSSEKRTNASNENSGKDVEFRGYYY